VRERPKTGGFHHISLGMRIFASKAKMPHPLWGIFKDPFPQERVLEAAFFPSAFFAEACYHIKCNSKKTKNIDFKAAKV
jgi:hypothetical protein